MSQHLKNLWEISYPTEKYCIGRKENFLGWKTLTETNKLGKLKKILDHRGLTETFLNSQNLGKEKGGSKRRSLSDSGYDDNKSEE